MNRANKLVIESADGTVPTLRIRQVEILLDFDGPLVEGHLTQNDYRKCGSAKKLLIILSGHLLL